MATDEKALRVYYQDIVYYVCNALDRINRRQPGRGVVCGTFETPTRNVQQQIDAVADAITRVRLIATCDHEGVFGWKDCIEAMAADARREMCKSCRVRHMLSPLWTS